MQPAARRHPAVNAVEAVIRVRNLHYRYPGGAQALSGVNFELAPGECVALLGPNGSGKTTFILCLNGILESSGDVEVCGQLLSRTTAMSIRQRVGMVFQDADDQLIMPAVLDDVMFGLRNAGVSERESRQRAIAALAAVNLDGVADRAPWQLSAGEKRRVAIAGVLVTDPAVLVLDEPTTSLDPPGRRELIRLLKSLPQARIVITHDAGLARAVASRAVFFQQGRVAAEGPVEEILARFEWND
ncbi:MAG TPA: ABC transporter ATP-binding protein [Bryobacteraceae bacterium]|nr:ABC transporter ATP-binding protein [Bryobacteraceae bacterium]